MFIDDPSGALSAQAKAQIQDATSAFDVKVVISATDTRAGLDAKVSEMVNSANTLAIGVDPVHHFTFTHFGVGTGIPRERYQDVARAGNGEFKQGHWGEGINAIVASAAASRQTSHATTTIVMPTQQTTVEHPFPVLPLVGAAVALALGFFLLWRWSRRKTAEVAATLDDFRGEAAQMRSRNIEEQEWHDKMKQNQGAAALTTSPEQRNAATQAPSAQLPPPQGYASIPPAAAPVHVHHYHRAQPAPAAPPVYIQQSGGNDLLTGVLIGEAISSRPVERERVIERHYTPPPARHDTPAPSYSSSSDSSSSSWGDSSSSSFDSGSSGGDFGGGFDGGGGGGDF